MAHVETSYKIQAMKNKSSEIQMFVITNGQYINIYNLQIYYIENHNSFIISLHKFDIIHVYYICLSKNLLI